MKKSNEPIDTICRRVLRKRPVEATPWLIANPNAYARDTIVERLKVLTEAGALTIYIGELVEHDDGSERIEQLIVTLPPTDKKIAKLVEVIQRTEFSGAGPSDIGRHYAALDGPTPDVVPADE
jgi:hypothetical protein